MVIVVTDGTKISSLLDDVLLSANDIIVVCSLLDITLVDIIDNADVSSLLDSELVLFSDGMGVTSLLEMILTEVGDDVLPETKLVNISDEAETCPVAVLGIVEFSSLFMTVPVEVTTCTDVNIVFDAEDDVDVDTVLVAVINWEVRGCSLLDMIFILLMDDVDIIVLSDTEALDIINCREVCSPLDVTLAGINDVELSPLLATTVCAELSSLLNTALVDVPDNE